MKKKFIKLTNLANLGAIKKRVKDAFSERGQEAADAIRDLIDELEQSEVEVDEEVLAEKIREVIDAAEPNSKTEEAIANAIAKRMQAITNTVEGKKLSPAIKNQISAAVLRAHGKEEIADAVNGVLVRNDITGLSFEDVVDFAIVEAWGDLNPIFAQLHKTLFTKFYYNEDELKTAKLLAKQWDKTGESEKVIQDFAATGKQIQTRYIYKRQRASQEDLDDIEKNGNLATFLRFINEELDRMIVNTIVLAILIGDNVNDAADRVTTFETIGTKTVSDLFTTVKAPIGQAITLEDMRALCDAVKNPFGKKKILIMHATLLSQIAKANYAADSTPFYRSNEELAKMVGADEIITCDLMDDVDTANGIYAIAMLPDGYWYNEKKAISVAYPEYAKNAMNYQKERNIGGGIHDLYSTAVLKGAAAKGGKH